MTLTTLQSLYRTHEAQIGLTTRYLAVGLLSIGIQIAFLYLWVSVLGLKYQYLLGVVLGFLIAFCTAFFLQKYWTFRDVRREGRGRQFFWYSVVALLSLGLNELGLIGARALLESFGTNFFDTWYLVAQATLLGCIALLSFLGNRFITFRESVIP